MPVLKSEEEKLQSLVSAAVAEYPDFPRKGVLFRDVFGVLERPEAFAALRSLLLLHVDRLEVKPDAVVALDARGFLLGPLVALHLSVPFVPVRKSGKLPGDMLSVSYRTEYSQDTLQLRRGSVKGGQNVLILDDLIATGGSMLAACQLVESAGARVSCCLAIVELKSLGGRQHLAPRRLDALFSY